MPHLKGRKDPSKPKDLSALLLQKDQEISYLHTQLAARIAHAANLQSRVLSTLDALDASQAACNQELQDIHRLNEQLRDKLHLCTQVVQTAEEEKEDLRDAVLKLVEKVETSNDYSKWPHSRIDLSGSWLLSNTSQFTTQTNVSSDSQAYAPTLIENLSRELAQERKAHLCTQSEAGSRLASLEAQLARREAELEHRILSDIVPATKYQSGLKAPFGKERTPTPPTLSPSDAVAILENAATRNRVLESEIRTLSQKLEETKQAAAHTSNPMTSGPDEPNVDQRQHDLHVSKSVQTDQDASNYPKPPALQHTRKLPLDPSPSVPPSIIQRGSHSMPRCDPLSALDQQIAELGTHVSALTTERDVLQHMIDKVATGESTLDAKHKTKIDFPGILLIEEECIRLMRSETALRAELENVRKAAQQREDSLCAHIERLKAELQNYHGTSSDQPDMNSVFIVSSSTTAPTSSSFAHPLTLPSFSLSAIEPSCIPLPVSPPSVITHSSNPPQIRCVPVPSTPLSRPTRDAALIERELEQAKREAAEREQAMAVLKATIDDLRRKHLPGGT